jgi:hypothetical protein
MAGLPIGYPMPPLARATPPASAPGFFPRLAGLIAHHLHDRSHVRIVITLREGRIQVVNVDQSFEPNDLPELEPPRPQR